MLEFCILGPLEVRHDGRTLDLGGPRGRALLAVLLVHAGAPISTDALTQALLGAEAPPTAAKAVQVLLGLAALDGDDRRGAVPHAAACALSARRSQPTRCGSTEPCSGA